LLLISLIFEFEAPITDFKMLFYYTEDGRYHDLFPPSLVNNRSGTWQDLNGMPVKVISKLLPKDN